MSGATNQPHFHFSPAYVYWTHYVSGFVLGKDWALNNRGLTFWWGRQAKNQERGEVKEMRERNHSLQQLHRELT